MIRSHPQGLFIIAFVDKDTPDIRVTQQQTFTTSPGLVSGRLTKSTSMEAIQSSSPLASRIECLGAASKGVGAHVFYQGNPIRSLRRRCHGAPEQGIPRHHLGECGFHVIPFHAPDELIRAVKFFIDAWKSHSLALEPNFGDAPAHQPWRRPSLPGPCGLLAKAG